MLLEGCGRCVMLQKSSPFFFLAPLGLQWVFLVAQMAKNLSAVRETWVRSLGWADPLEEGHDDPFQYSYLETPLGGGGWRATVHRVTKSQTRLSE